MVTHVARRAQYDKGGNPLCHRQKLRLFFDSELDYLTLICVRDRPSRNNNLMPRALKL